MPISVHEVADSQRSVRWILSRAVGTLGRRTHDHRVLFLLVVVACGAVLAGAFVAGIWIFLAVVVMILAAALLPVARQLGRGRVWEAWLTTPDGSHRIGGWVIAVPHPRDRDTWRIDIVQDPRHPASSGWAHAVLPALHYAGRRPRCGAPGG